MNRLLPSGSLKSAREPEDARLSSLALSLPLSLPLYLYTDANAIPDDIANPGYIT